MTRMDEFFGVTQPIRQPQRELIRENQGIVLEYDMTINQNPQQDRINHRVEIEQPRVEIPRIVPQIPRAVEQGIVMVNRNQNADEVVQQVRHHNYAPDNNLTTTVERIMAQNGVNIDFHRPNFTYPLSDYTCNQN